jgi:hypothetical protein
MLRRAILKSLVATIMIVGSVGGVGVLTTGAAAASTQAPANSTVRSAPLIPPTSNRCTNATHTVPCWALTFHASDGHLFNCTNKVPLFLRAGGTYCLGGNDLVLITCYYRGTPTVFNDNIQDHVTRENAGNLSKTGHIPDYFIDLNNHNPADLGIGGC